MAISTYGSQRVHPEPAWRSLAPPNGRILPREGSPALPDIPLTRIGLVDTLKLRLDGRVYERDLERLQKTGEFTRKESGLRKAIGTGGAVKDLGRQAFMSRKRDGLRLTAYERCTFVEFSAPRVLGLYSDEQHLMSECDLRRAVDMATVDLLPWSTVRAELRYEADPWSVYREDLAVNFDGSIVEIIEALRKQTHFLVRGSRSTVFDGSGIGWFGTDWDIVIYDPITRPPRGKLRERTKHQEFRPQTGLRCRIELRMKTKRSVERYASLLEVHGGGLPYSIACKSGERRNVRLLIDNDLAHRFLARAVAGFQRSNCAPLDYDNYRSFGSYAQRKLLALHPEEWAVAEAMLSLDVLRDLRKSVTAVSLEMRRINLLWQVWKGRRLSPLTLWDEQVRREELATSEDRKPENIPRDERSIAVLRMLNASWLRDARGEPRCK